jgi:hypothetical protein
MYQGTTSVVLFCQLAGNDSNENKELPPVFSGVPATLMPAPRKLHNFGGKKLRRA